MNLSMNTDPTNSQQQQRVQLKLYLKAKKYNFANKLQNLGFSAKRALTSHLICLFSKKETTSMQNEYKKRNVTGSKLISSVDLKCNFYLRLYSCKDVNFFNQQSNLPMQTVSAPSSNTHSIFVENNSYVRQTELIQISISANFISQGL
ncbi:hypothetical protein ABPG74_012997 [Tetrahymena malaccensis]